MHEIWNIFRINKLAIFAALVVSLISCSSSDQIIVLIDENPSIIEQSTANDLKSDLEMVTNQEVSIVSSSSRVNAKVQFVIGTAHSNNVKSLVDGNQLTLTPSIPGSRGGVILKVNKNTILLCGSDMQGMQYAVYDFSKNVLKTDPLRYWSGHKSEALTLDDLLKFEDQIVPPPKVPLLGYFENDADELMNLKKPLLTYDWESFTEMIDALVRMKYNVFHFFDALGRSEFYRRKEYQDLAPDYKVDMDYVEKMIDYAHEKGMLVQIDLSMGYQDKSLESDYADCWSQHKDKWKEVWNYYLKETAFGKADIYSLRPRNQVWDWEYKSNCGEEKISTFNEVYQELGEIISAHNPNAKKVLVCYADAMDMFNEGFNPPEDWIVAWSDDGYSDFKVLPKSTKGYPFGTYMHAGFWKNHTVGHPYPHMIDSIMHMMFDRYDATAYCLVNGQQFRPFIFNLEAFSDICIDPESFSGANFYKKWANRYFEPQYHDEIIQLMNNWDEASFGKAGYVQNLWEIKEAIAYLSEKNLERPGRPSVQYEARRVENDLEDAQRRYPLVKGILLKAESIQKKMGGQSAYFYDQIYHPILLYSDLLAFEVKLHEIYKVKRILENSSDADLSQKAMLLIQDSKVLLENVYKNSLIDAKDPKWNGWYDPKVRRPNNGFPKMEMINDIEQLFSNKY